MSIKDEKKALRARMREAVKSLPESYYREAGRIISHRLTALDAYKNADTVFSFVGHGKELDTEPFIRRALADGKRVCVPLCLGNGQMEACIITDLSELSAGAFGIPEPGVHSARVMKTEIGFTVVPCLSCDRSGHRLGRGGGYYDRFLSGYNGSAVMVCPEKLVSISVPSETHDITVLPVITEI